ncbi:DUF4307 domain-containing protein [Streptomyces sp. C10-9-1]|uniref:DUF4307 domain-containing protein n=1 Tax=Streptomyces sp. C10-9-1 TaxID=1859285 RepID=UPI002112F07A|nr:DUF4307 domain-containing protein [Streptomyces sp. C10-9-1]MCQ6556774.1 DUF4307 domain-containing protein [Streptomyces sp. C10-9-1]
MTAAREGLPQGRYGRSADERADRGLRVLGAVLGTVAVAVVGWFGYDYVAGRTLSAEVIKFDVVQGANEVQMHLEVRKDADATGTCTVRALAEDGTEVGRLDARFEETGTGRIDRVVRIRTTREATGAELVGCTAA